MSVYRKSIQWSLISVVLSSVMQWLIIVILTKSGSAQSVGEYTYALSIVSPIFLCLGLQLRNVAATDTKSEYNAEVYISLRILGSAIAFLIGCVLMLLLNKEGTVKLALLAVAGWKMVDSIGDIIYGLFQKSNRMKEIAASTAIKATVGLICFSVGWFTAHNVGGSIIALASVWLLTVYFYDYRILQKSESKFALKAINWKTVGKLLVKTYPLGIVILLNALSLNVPRYYVEHYYGLNALGYFSALSYISIVFGLLVSAYGQAASSQLSRYFTEGRKVEFGRSIMKSSMVVAGLGVFGAIVVGLYGKPIIGLIYSAEYAQFQTELLLFMIAATISGISSICGYAITACQVFGKQVPLNIIFLIAVTICCWFLIPRYGLIGSCYALLLFSSFQIPMKLFLLYKAWKMKPQGGDSNACSKA